LLALPAASVGAVHSTGAFRVLVKHGPGLLVLDHQKRTRLAVEVREARSLSHDTGDSSRRCLESLSGPAV
jgi:hypothetical protein